MAAYLFIYIGPVETIEGYTKEKYIKIMCEQDKSCLAQMKDRVGESSH